MCRVSSAQISRLLTEQGQSDQGARGALSPLNNNELRRIARQRRGRERPDHTLRSAALVIEAYLRLLRKEPPQWQNRAHFFGVAAQLMRHILVDHARGHLAAERRAGISPAVLKRELKKAEAK